MKTNDINLSVSKIRNEIKSIIQEKVEGKVAKTMEKKKKKKRRWFLQNLNGSGREEKCRKTGERR